MQILFKFRIEKTVRCPADRKVDRIAQELLAVNTQRVVSVYITLFSFFPMCLLKKHLPPLPLCHMEEVLFSFYHLKLLKCPQARDGSLESPFLAAGSETATSVSLQDINREQVRNIFKIPYT